MFKLFNLLKTNKILVFNFFLYIILVLCGILLPINIYHIVMSIMPLIGSQHVLLTSDYEEIILVIFAMFTWFVVSLFRRPGFIKSILGLFGPVSLSIANSKFIYAFHTTRKLFSDAVFFKFFGFGFYHKYTKSEFLIYADQYLRNHNALDELYLQLSALFDSNSISTIKEWTELLDSLLSLNKDFVSIPSTLDNLLSFIYSHPYIVAGTVLICVFFLRDFYVWYSSSREDQIVNLSKLQVATQSTILQSMLNTLQQDDSSEPEHPLESGPDKDKDKKKEDEDERI